MPNAKDVTPDTEYLKAFITGEYGTGKSVLASTFPTPGFVFDFDGGILTYRGEDFDYEQYTINPQGWIKFEKDLHEVKKRVLAGKYKTVIVDSTSTMSAVAMERALQLDPKRSETDGPLWNVHYQLVKNLMEGRLRTIISFPCNLVIIAHFTYTKDKNGNVISIDPKLTGTLSSDIPGMFDEVYCAFAKPHLGSNKYYLRTVPWGLYKARSRLSGKMHFLPDEIENSYGALMKHVKANISHLKEANKPKLNKTQTQTQAQTRKTN